MNTGKCEHGEHIGNACPFCEAARYKIPDEIKVTGRVLTISEATRRRNPELYGKAAQITATTGQLPPPPPPPKGKRMRQDQKPLLNKLETDWLRTFSPGYPPGFFKPQSKRYKLGNGIWYKPDFTAHQFLTLDGPTAYKAMETAWEVKGPKAFRGGFENLKVAASLWPDVRWLLVWKESGQWKQQEVLH